MTGFDSMDTFNLSYYKRFIRGVCICHFVKTTVILYRKSYLGSIVFLAALLKMVLHSFRKSQFSGPFILITSRNGQERKTDHSVALCYVNNSIV
jgi:hypothetical protein